MGVAKSDDLRNEEETRSDAASGRVDPEAATTEVPPEAAADEQELDPLEALRAELEQLEDKNLRLVAELRNVQQRAQRERQESLRFAEFDFARDLLVILDDLERTQESARDADDVQAVVDGVRIVSEHVLKIFKDRGIEPIPALGENFDPALHEALMQQASDEYEAGVVMVEQARGFKMHERVLRPSKVVVSSGPAGPE